jgi:type II secretory pathway component PulL
MATQVWMLELGRMHWHLHATARDGAAALERHEFRQPDLVDQGEPIRESLKNAGYRDEPVVVALGPNWTLAATIEVNRPQELRVRRTMLFRLEEHIPWSVEDCVSDYVRSGPNALMVAVPGQPLAEFFHRLQSLGVQIQSIVPLPLLAAAEHLDSDKWPAKHVVIFEHQGWADALVVDEGQVVSWWSFPASAASVTQELKRLSLESGRAVELVGYGLGACATSLETLASANVITSPVLKDDACNSLASAAAAKILRGRLEPPIELMRNEFGRSRSNPVLRPYLAAMTCAFALFLLTTCGALWYRGQSAKSEAEILFALQSELYCDTFPNTKVPVGIKGRMESELAKLKGLKGDDASLPISLSAATVLHRMLAAMPTDRRFRLLEIRIEEGRLYLDGEVIEHGDAELIVHGLRARGFEVASPRTQRLDDKRISLRITGTIDAPTTLAARNLP